MVVKLNKKYKNEYFENLNVATNSKPFWDKCKPYFSNKHANGDSNIMLIEKDKILLKNKKIADVLNSYFDSVTDSLDLFSWSTQTDSKNTDEPQNILIRFHNHSSLIKLKQLVKGLYPPNFFKRIIFGILMFFDTLSYGESPYVNYFCLLELFVLLFFITKLTVLSNVHSNEI